MRHDEGCELSTCKCENGRLDRLEEDARTVSELNRVKPGASLTRFDPPLNAFGLAERTIPGSLVGYELHLEGGERVLVGHVNKYGVGWAIGPSGLANLEIVAARKAYL